SRRLLRNRKNDDVATLLPILLESFCGQALASCHPLNVLVGDALPLLPARVENGGLKSGAARGIWIALGSDIEPSFLRTLHHSDQRGRILESHTRDVDDVQRGARCGRRRDYFFDSYEAGRRLLQSRVP